LDDRPNKQVDGRMIAGLGCGSMRYSRTKRRFRGQKTACVWKLRITQISFTILTLSGLLSCTPIDLGERPFFCNSGIPQCPNRYRCNADNECINADYCVENPGLPQCISKHICGDGVCGITETVADCPSDCRLDEACNAAVDLTRCEGSRRLLICGTQNKWELHACDDICAARAESDYGVGCTSDDETQRGTCACDNYKGQGADCDAFQRCNPTANLTCDIEQGSETGTCQPL